MMQHWRANAKLQHIHIMRAQTRIHGNAMLLAFCPYVVNAFSMPMQMSGGISWTEKKGFFVYPAGNNTPRREITRFDRAISQKRSGLTRIEWKDALAESFSRAKCQVRFVHANFLGM